MYDILMILVDLCGNFHDFGWFWATRIRIRLIETDPENKTDLNGSGSETETLVPSKGNISVSDILWKCCFVPDGHAKAILHTSAVKNGPDTFFIIMRRRKNVPNIFAFHIFGINVGVHPWILSAGIIWPRPNGTT